MTAIHSQSRRRGVAIVYVMCIMALMLGMCSLAVDLGRVETAKTELRRLADAAARAAAATIPQGTTNAKNAALAFTNAGENKVDGATFTLGLGNVSVGYWTSSGGFSASNPGNASQAVEVGPISYNVPLLFGAILGRSTCTVTATSVAALVAQPSSTSRFVSAHSNPWLAGEPAGTTASVPDPNYNVPSANNDHPWKYDVANPGLVATAQANYVAGGESSYSVPTDSSKITSTDYSSGQPYSSPPEFVLSVAPGSIVEVSVPVNSSNISNVYGYLDGSYGGYYANGDNSGTYTLTENDAANSTTSGGNANPGNSSGTLPQGSTSSAGLSNSEHGISNILTPFGSVVGVFMDQNGATHGADSSQETGESGAPGTPTGLDFSTQAARDYQQLEPKLNQAFYVGSGQNSSGNQQMILVPKNAYALYLGTMDGHEYSNNTGGLNVTITQYEIEIVK